MSENVIILSSCLLVGILVCYICISLTLWQYYYFIVISFLVLIINLLSILNRPMFILTGLILSHQFLHIAFFPPMWKMLWNFLLIIFMTKSMYKKIMFGIQEALLIWRIIFLVIKHLYSVIIFFSHSTISFWNFFWFFLLPTFSYC